MTRKAAMLAMALLVLGVGGWMVSPAARAGGEDSLHEHMEGMNKALKRLHRRVGDAEKAAESLELIASFEEHALAAKLSVPETAEELEGDAKRAFVVDFRKRMVAVVKTALGLEESLLDGDQAAAKAALAELEKLEHAGHEKFREEEEDED